MHFTMLQNKDQRQAGIDHGHLPSDQCFQQSIVKLPPQDAVSIGESSRTGHSLGNTSSFPALIMSAAIVCRPLPLGSGVRAASSGQALMSGLQRSLPQDTALPNLKSKLHHGAPAFPWLPYLDIRPAITTLQKWPFHLS